MADPQQFPEVRWLAAADNPWGVPVLDVRSAEGATPLMNAVQAKNTAQLTFFLDHGADANAADGRGCTALHGAAEMGQAEVVKLLLARGARPDAETAGQTPRSLAEKRGEAAVLEVLDHWPRS